MRVIPKNVGIFELVGRQSWNKLKCNEALKEILAVIVFPVFDGGSNLMQIYGNFKELAQNTALFGLVSQNDPWKNWKKCLNPPVDFFHVLVRLGAFFCAFKRASVEPHLMIFLCICLIFPNLLFSSISIFSKLCQWIWTWGHEFFWMRSWILISSWCLVGCIDTSTSYFANT